MKAASSTVSPDPRRSIPPISRLLDSPEFSSSIQQYGSQAVVVQLRDLLHELRQRLSEDGPQHENLEAEALAARVQERLRAHWGEPARRVINATGVFLHTNLGRAPLAREVLAEMVPLLEAATDVELDLSSGRRSDRNRRVAKLLSGLVGSESALVVNNNAAALMLILAELVGSAQQRREVVVSRGELVEIGGSFRIPDILRAAGCRLVEVGTTNRTRLSDYRSALGEGTGLLLKVHPSNYRVRGFTAEVGAGELVALGREFDLPVVVDEGSGLLRPSERPQLRDHTSISELVDAGVSLACGSGDKLLGGPQAGLVFGGREHIEALRRNPLYRAVRPSRQIIVTLAATLRLHLSGSALPIDRLWDDGEGVRRRLIGLQRLIEAAGSKAQISSADAFVGGGAAPDAPLGGEALSLEDDGGLAALLRRAPHPVMGYVKEGRLVLDLRTVDPRDDDRLGGSVTWALARRAGDARIEGSPGAANGDTGGTGGTESG